MSNRRSNPDPLDRARPQTSKSPHVIPCSERSNTRAVKARPEVVRTGPARPIPRTSNVAPLTPEQEKLVEDMETRWVDLDRNLKLEVPKVVFEEAYRYGPPAAGARPRHPRYVDMVLAGTEAVIRAARTFNPEFGDGKVDFAEYARRGVRHAVAEQLSDRLVRVPRKRQKEWPKERLVAVESWDGLAKSVTTRSALRAAMLKQALGDNSLGDEGNEFTADESRTETRSRWAEKFERAREIELQAPIEEEIEALEGAQEAALVLRQEWAEGVLSVRGLTPTEQRALILRYGLNGANLGTVPSFAKISVVMGVSAERTRQLVRNGERKLKKQSTEQEEALPLLTWKQLRRHSSSEEKHRPAWEDEVLKRIDEDRATERERKMRRPRIKARLGAAAAGSRERRGEPDSVRRLDQRLAEGSVELKEVA